MITEFGILEFRRTIPKPPSDEIHTLQVRYTEDPRAWFWSETGDLANANRELGNDRGLTRYLAAIGAEGWLLAGCGGTEETGAGPIRLFFQRSVREPQIPKPGYIGEDAERDADYYATMERAIRESEHVTEEDRERLLGEVDAYRRREEEALEADRRLIDRVAAQRDPNEVESAPPPLLADSPLTAIIDSGASTEPKGHTRRQSAETLDMGDTV